MASTIQDAPPATTSAFTTGLTDEKRAALMNQIQNFNEGPAHVIDKPSGTVADENREDDASYLTNSEAHPFSEPAHVCARYSAGPPQSTIDAGQRKQQTFKRSKNSGEVVFPCGSGAFGYCEHTDDVADLTKADFLSSFGKKKPAFLRFSAVTFDREFPDEARNPRGFAMKLHTTEGGHDIVGLNLPEFFGRDPSQGPDNIQPQEQNQSNSPSDLDTLFERLSSTPEANRTGLVFFSDHGTPQGWLLNHGYGCHTFKWVNDEGKSVYFKYHFMSKHDQKQFTDGGTLAMGGEDPDYLKPDLWEAIEIGEDIGWIAPVQGTDPNKTDPHIVGSNPFDPTRGWPRRPSHNKNPEYFYRDVDQASVSSESPGFEDFPDSPSLRFPMFFYRDSRNHWIGVCLQQIPDNRPSMAEAFNFDGQVRVDANHAGNKRYARNSFSHKFRPDVSEVPCDANDDFMFR